MRRARILLLSFLGGAGLMTAELAAPRLLAPHLGTSVLVWIATIGTFLGGLALGSAIGGRLADRAPRALLPVLFGASAALLASAVPLDAILAENLRGLAHVPRVLLAVPLEFLGTATAIGAIGPALARAALGLDGRPGRSLGAVAAAGAAGSVLGTFLAGFAWIPSFGTRTILLGTAAALVGGAVLAFRLEVGAPRRAAPRAEPAPLRGFGALAALAGGALLAVEVAIGRVAAERIGASLYTWTSVIGVVLFGISIGNAVGGRLADRLAPRRLLGSLLLVASLAVAASIWTPAVLRPVLALQSLPYAARTLLAVTVAFLAPAVALGTLSPALTRAALAAPETDGRVVGRLGALGSVGAVLATGLTGLVLVPALGIPALLASIALALALAAAFVRRRVHVPWTLALVALVLCATLPFPFARVEGRRLRLRDDAPGTWVSDSRYMHVVVRPLDWRWFRLRAPPSPTLRERPDLAERVVHNEEKGSLYWYGPMSEAEEVALRPFLATEDDRRALAEMRPRTAHRVRTLTLDRIVHGFVDLDDPLWFGYDYETVYSGVVERAWPVARAAPVRALFLGAGPFGFQRRLKAQHGDGIASVTAEIDPEVVRAGREALGLADGVTEVAVEDARTFVKGRPDDAPRFDLVFGDTFDDLSVPWHLTTLEFAQEVKSRMTPDGTYLVNLVDSFDSGRFVGAFLRTLERTFRNVRLFSASPRHDDLQETFVLVATDRDLDLAGLPGAEVYGPADLAALRARPGPAVLTDDHAPVEALLAPVVAVRSTR